MLITKDKLDIRIKELFLSSQLDRIEYSSLSDDDKQVILKNANDEMNKLQWIGSKVNNEQSDSWPRIINDKVVELPDTVISAMAQYSYDFIRVMNNDTYDEIRKGITSYSIGPIKESYDISKSDFSINKTYMKYLNGLIYRGVR